VVSEEQLQATGLSERILQTYRLAGDTFISKERSAEIAEEIGKTPTTVKTHLSRVRVKLADPKSMVQPTVPGAGDHSFETKNPAKFADAVVAMSAPGATAAQVARDVGIGAETAARIGRQLDGELRPLGRKLEDVRLEDLTKRFGTLARDAVDAITQTKLDAASAQQLAIIAGVATDKFQLLRGQPTQRMDITDRREMNEILKLIVDEAKRRNIEIDVTPEGATSATKSPYRSAAHKREVQRIESGDPVETLVPA